MTAFFTAPSIAWGPGAVEQLSGLGATRAFVAADPRIAGSPPMRRVVEELEKSGAAVELAPATGDPDSPGGIEARLTVARAFGPDWIVAVGGGRTIDGAKALRLLLECPELTLDALPPVLPLPERPVRRLVAIPTTSGSGAEASGTVDLLRADGTPFELSDRRLAPEWAVVDPGFAEGVPAPDVVPTALEAAGEAIEAFLSAWANPFSDALALDAAVTIVRRLPHAVKWSGDPDARAALHYAATNAGLAASNAQRGLAHALARALVRPTGRAYGLLVALVLPSVLEFDRPGARDRLEQLAAAVAPPDERAVTPLAVRLRRLADNLRLPPDLRSAGVDVEELRRVRDRIVADTLASPAVLANPRVPSAGDVHALLDGLTGRGPP
ncbi:MAG TPA: iron-containing alcohol dehydrogenase [Thermoplasmata archaeon]|nr:iron-containing alcohol dehydrogenase [Thermoplasmata archaeon]